MYALRYPAGRPDGQLEAEIKRALSYFYRRSPEQVAGIELDYSNPSPSSECPRAMTRDCCQPPHHLLERCERYENGQCWFTMGHPRDEGQRPMAVHTHRADRRAWAYGREVERDEWDLWRLLIATSALEVGFDNPELIATWQYHAPQSVAAFVQRKGRGGRGPRDYPISLVVLGSRSRDVYWFQDHLRLVEVEQRDIATYIDPQNPSVRAQHLVSAVFDYCAARKEYSEAYQLQFQQLALAVRSGGLQAWLQECFPTEAPARLAELLQALSRLIAYVWDAPLDFTALPTGLRPAQTLRPSNLFPKKGQTGPSHDDLVRWRDAARGQRGASRIYAWTERVLARESQRAKVWSVVDFFPFVPEDLADLELNEQSRFDIRDLRVPNSTIPEPLGRHVEVRATDDRSLEEEPSEFALQAFLPGGFKIRYNGDLWMAPWDASDHRELNGCHIAWASVKDQIEAVVRPDTPPTVAEALEQSALGTERKRDWRRTVGDDCLLVPIGTPPLSRQSRWSLACPRQQPEAFGRSLAGGASET